MKRTPNKVVVEFSPTCDVLCAACTSPAGLGLQGKGKCNHIGGVLFVIEDFICRGLHNHPEPLTCTSRLSVWVVPHNQSVAAKPLDKVLIRKIRFGKKNIRIQPKIINFDPRSLQEQNCDDESFENVGPFKTVYQQVPSFFFMTLIQIVLVLCQTNEETKHQEGVPFTDNFDIATSRFLVDEHVSSLTVTGDEIENTERLNRGQNKNEFWYEKRKTLLTASNFGKAAKTKIKPSKKLKAMLYTNFTTRSSTVWDRE